MSEKKSIKNKGQSFLARIRNLAKETGFTPALIRQNYMTERFFVRLASSRFKDSFILKGGVLVSSLVGLVNRTTLDIDVSLKNVSLTSDAIRAMLEEIFSIPLADDVTFEFKSISSIHEDDIYGGYRVKFTASYAKTLSAFMSIDISTGDSIVPAPMLHQFPQLFDKSSTYQLLGYPIETILAEKVETILQRGVFNTRMKDYYDIVVLARMESWCPTVFMSSLVATMKHRQTIDRLAAAESIFETLEADANLQKLWKAYQRKFSYARAIAFPDVFVALRNLLA